MSKKLNIDNIIEIKEIKSILSKDKRLLDIFNTLLKLLNKKINDDKLQDIIDDDSDSLYSDSLYSEDLDSE